MIGYQEVFVPDNDYWQLKQIVKQVKTSIKRDPPAPQAGLLRRNGVIGWDSIEGSSGVSSASAESHGGNILSIAYIYCIVWNVCVIPTGFSDEFMMTLFSERDQKSAL